MRTLRATCLVALLALFAAPVVANVNVYSNDPTGDNFTNAGPGNTGLAIGSSGWVYNNVRNNGVVGINGNLARSGNGSVFLESTQGPGGASSKADIEYWSSLGKLGDLSSLSYDWYRMTGGDASANLHPALRLWISNGTYSGYIVFEREINRDVLGNPVIAPVDQWQTDDVFGSDYRMWSTSSLPFNLNGSNGAFKYYDALKLSEWRDLYGDYNVLGVSAGVGSGWGTFAGAVDNITFGFSGVNTTYNFEVAQVIPAPGAALLAFFGLGLVGWVKRRMA